MNEIVRREKIGELLDLLLAAQRLAKELDLDMLDHITQMALIETSRSIDRSA